MKKSTIYFVEVESASLNSVWSGTFDEPVDEFDILTAMNIDIAELRGGREHERDRAEIFQTLKGVIEHTSQIDEGTTEVKVAGCKIGEINIILQSIFTNRTD
jgi:hypothetical protein